MLLRACATTPGIMEHARNNNHYIYIYLVDIVTTEHLQANHHKNIFFEMQL